MSKTGNIFVKMEVLLQYVMAELIWQSSVRVLHTVQHV